MSTATAQQQLTPEQEEKLKRFEEFKTKPIEDIDHLQAGDLLLVKKGQTIETVTMPFGDPKIIEEDGSLFIATKAHNNLQEGDLVQIVDCIAFEREGKIYPYAVRMLHESEAIYVIFNDFMNTKAIGAQFLQVVTEESASASA